MINESASEVFSRLAEMIEASKKKVKICSPDPSFYASDHDWSKDEIEIIDADCLIDLLKKSTIKQT